MTLLELLQTHPSYIDSTNPTDAVLFAWGNEIVTSNKSVLTGDEMFQSTDGAEFAALTDVKKQLWVSFCGHDIDPFAGANVAFVQWVFGGGSTTVSNLASERTEQITRFAANGVNCQDESVVHAARN